MNIPSIDEIRADIDAMGIAIDALSRIPSAARLQLAFSWLQARVTSDIAHRMEAERIERIAALTEYVDDRLTEIVGDAS